MGRKEKTETFKLRLFAAFIIAVLLTSGYFMSKNQKESSMDNIISLKLHH
jgi:hypothetical protein